MLLTGNARIDALTVAAIVRGQRATAMARIKTRAIRARAMAVRSAITRRRHQIRNVIGRFTPSPHLLRGRGGLWTTTHQ